MTRAVRYGILILLLASIDVFAMEVAGVSVPESVSIESSGVELILNRAGVQKKLFVDVYVEALYLTQRTSDVKKILDMTDAKRITLHFIYDKVNSDRLVAGWQEYFQENLTEEEMKALQDSIVFFADLLPSVQRGDVIRLDFIPEMGTRVWFNDELLYTIAGKDFYRSLLKAWLDQEV